MAAITVGKMDMTNIAAIDISALAGGMAQSYLVRKKPDWGMVVGVALIGVGGYLAATQSGILGALGLGVGAAGASSFGLAAVEKIFPGEGTARLAPPAASRPLALQAGRRVNTGVPSYATASVGWQPEPIR